MSEETTENPEISHKPKGKKKRKSFLYNAKKYARKGLMGCGTQMPEEVYQYFVGILESMKQGITDPDDRRAMVDNVLERTKGIEFDVIGNQLGCRVIELLLPMASSEDLERFMDIAFTDLRKFCSGNFTSHAVETVLRVACDRATMQLQPEQQNDEIPQKRPKLEPQCQYDEKHITTCNEFTLKFSKYALNNLEDFVWDNFANHILRVVLKCLSGITLIPGEKPKVNMFIDNKNEVKKGIPPHVKCIDYKVTPQEYKDIVSEFAERLMSWPQFKDLPFQNITSALLQVLLFAVKNVDKNVTKSLLKKLLNESFAPDVPTDVDNTEPDKKEDKKDLCDSETLTTEPSLPPAFSSIASVRLLEAALFVARKKIYTQIYAKCFINRLLRLTTSSSLLHLHLQFTIQRLFDNCDVKEEFEAMFAELSEHFDNILVSGNTGVLVAICKACLRLNTQQTRFLASLQSSLRCDDDEGQLLQCCLRLVPRDRIPDPGPDYDINVHGSVILQTVLHFQRPAKAVSAMLVSEPAELVRVLCDPKGSHLADALFSSPSAGAKARDKLLWKLKGQYQQLALSQHGSRALEAMFEGSSIEQKVRIVTELGDKSGLLQGSKWGRAVTQNLGVQQFRSNPDVWTARINADGKNKFKDVDKKT